MIGMKSIFHYWKFLLTVVVGLIALVLYFALRQESNAGWLVSIYAIFIAIILLVDMVKTLRSGSYGVDILAITAIVSTIAVGQFWAALVIVLMLTGGETLEDFADHRAKRELSALLDRAPQIAHLLHNKAMSDIPVSQVKPGDTVVVKPFEIIPVDGILLSDRATLDESGLTGESLPVDRASGDRVLSGAINGHSAIHIKATATAKDSQYEQIIKLVREAESNPAPFVRLADRYAVPFTLIAYIIAGTAWYISGDPVRFAEVLVVASPCPLILAAPIAIISGMSRASKHGIIVKGGAVIEKVASATTFAFDKTGTLTHGEVKVSNIAPVGQLSASELVRLAASAESGSSHVLAESILAYAKKHRMKLIPARNVREIAGDGIFATVSGHKLIVGKAAFLKKNKISGLKQVALDKSQTVILIAIDGVYAGAIYFADIVRHDTKTTIETLRRLGVNTIAMLTGDTVDTAKKVAAEAGVDQVYAELLPVDKVSVMKRLSSDKNTVVMVGDGVNDAPVLAAADVGIAMGMRGSTAASESADAVILLDRIDRVALLRTISKRSIGIALESVWVGILLCLVLMVIAAFGKIPALVGAGLQELIDVVVIFNALRAHRGTK